MDAERKVELLRAQIAGPAIPSDSAEFNGWREKTSSVFRLVLGKDHVLTERFGDIRYSPGSHLHDRVRQRPSRRDRASSGSSEGRDF